MIIRYVEFWISRAIADVIIVAMIFIGLALTFFGIIVGMYLFEKWKKWVGK